MRISAERHLAAPRETVWAALNDAETLRLSIPGCEHLEWLASDTLAADVRAKVGPVDTRFQGKVTLSEVDPPAGCRLTGEARSGTAGFASGHAIVRLSPAGSGTSLRWEVDATVGGRLAQVGSRLIDAAAQKLADEFFERFAARITPASDTGEDDARPAGLHEGLRDDDPAHDNPGHNDPGHNARGPEVPRREGLRPGVWVPTLIAAVLVLLVVVSRL